MVTMPRAFFILLDGGADRPVRELYYKTPLEAAAKPMFDRLACEGSCGILYTIKPGVRPGSDTAHLALFGYDPHVYYKGRGPFEAVGLGLEVKPGDVAFRTNLGTVDENNIVVDRRAGRYFTQEEIKEIEAIVQEACQEISKKFGVELVYKHGTEHRGALVLRGEKISHEVTGNDPHKTGVPQQKVTPLRDTEEARRTAEILNEFIELVMRKLSKARFNEERRRQGKPPANTMLIRGAGVLPEIEPITRRYKLRAAMIAGIALIKGIGKVLGFDLAEIPSYRGSRDDDFDAAFSKAVELLQSYDFVFLHVKPTDAYGHDGDARGKIEIIERVDKALKRVFENIPDDTYIVVTCDHATPVKVRDHTGDPVPFLMWGPDIPMDDVMKFCERECAKGYFGTILGLDVMNLICNYLGKLEKFGE